MNLINRRTYERADEGRRRAPDGWTGRGPAPAAPGAQDCPQGYRIDRAERTASAAFHLPGTTILLQPGA